MAKGPMVIAGVLGEVDWQWALQAWLHGSGCGDVSPGPNAPPCEPDEDELSPLEALRGRAENHFAADGWTPCHAAAADFDGRLVLFPGASGTGKSTLSVVLALRGHAVADELVLLREVGGDVEAVVPPLPLSVTEETFHRLSETAPWLLGQEYPPDGKIILKPPTPLHACPDGRCVAAVILLERQAEPKCGASLEHAPRPAAAKALLANIVHYSGGGAEYAGARKRAWEILCALLDRTPTYTLRGDLLSDGGAMVDSIEEVLRGGRHVQR
jgi:hypothetical protein